MEAIFIAGIVGFIGGGVLMFFMKDRILAADTSLHNKIDTLQASVISAANQLATHVTQQVQSIAPKPPAPPAL